MVKILICGIKNMGSIPIKHPLIEHELYKI